MFHGMERRDTTFFERTLTRRSGEPVEWVARLAATRRNWIRTSADEDGQVGLSVKALHSDGQGPRANRWAQCSLPVGARHARMQTARGPKWLAPR